MQFRLVVGQNLDSLSEASLKILYRSTRLVIQGTSDVTTITSSSGQQVFLAGNIEGLCSPSGATHALGPELTDEVRKLVGQNSLDYCRDTLEGRYVLVILGPGESCEVCTDRFGQIDLFYQEVGGQTTFATDLSLLPVSSGTVEYDQLALAHTLCVYGCRSPKRHTLYRGVRRLGVGETVRVQDGQVEFVQTPFKPVAVGDYGERELNEYADILLEAVEMRGSRNGNVVYLSSGWDSTALLACLVKIFGSRKVRAVIGRMQYAERSGVVNQFEIERAQAVAEYFGVRLDIVEFDYRSQIPDLLEQVRPLLLSHQIASLTAVTHGTLADFVARTTDGDEVVFAGEISDGAHNLGFSQFVTIFHPVLAFREYSDKMASYLYGPTFLNLVTSGQFLSDPIYGLLRGRCGDAIFDEPAEDDLSRRRQLLASFFLRSNRIPLYSLCNNKMLTDVGRELYSDEMEGHYLSRTAQELAAETLYSWYLHLYNSFHWQASTVATLALTAEAAGLHLVLPFWDSRLQDFLSAMPESWGRGLDLNPTKHPLKWALKNRIDYPLHLQVGPHSYLYDVDPNFSHGAETLYASAFAPYFKDRLKNRDYRGLLSPEIFDLNYIDGMIDRYVAGTEVRGAEMNDLMSLCQLSLTGWYGNE